MDTPHPHIPLTDDEAEDREEQQAILDKLLHGKPVPPAIVQRIRAKAQKMTDDLYRQHGLVDIGVPAIRELRDEA